MSLTFSSFYPFVHLTYLSVLVAFSGATLAQPFFNLLGLSVPVCAWESYLLYLKKILNTSIRVQSTHWNINYLWTIVSALRFTCTGIHTYIIICMYGIHCECESDREEQLHNAYTNTRLSYFESHPTQIERGTNTKSSAHFYKALFSAPNMNIRTKEMKMLFLCIFFSLFQSKIERLVKIPGKRQTIYPKRFASFHNNKVLNVSTLSRERCST